MCVPFCICAKRVKAKWISLVRMTALGLIVEENKLTVKEFDAILLGTEQNRNLKET